MSDERRYDEAEVRRIFEAAAETETATDVAGRHRDTARAGLTLPELRTIASEVGIPPDLVSRAAKALDRSDSGAALAPISGRDAVVYRRVAGVPVALERDVALPRNLSEDEWARLVMELRRTFSARGETEAVGPVREWRNGNLFVSLAPSPDGAVLSMGTRKGNARQMAAASVALLTMATVLFLVMVLTGEIAEAGAVFTPAFLAALGMGFLGVNAIGLPPWARTRARQLEDVGALALALAAGEAHEEADAPADVEEA